MSSRFERTASETIHEGGFITLRHEIFAVGIPMSIRAEDGNLGAYIMRRV